jgi:RNA polymerase sigma factor (sigma-70 family)
MPKDTKLVERAEKILDTPLRVFPHPDFDDKSKIPDILADIPDAEAFAALKKKVANLRKANLSPEMRPCYEEPLLTREQEYHLFRKMNYYKYKAKLLKTNLNLKRQLSERRVEQIEYYLSKAAEVRNQIANSNFRLATQILRKDINHFHDPGVTETFLSDAYLDVLKAVDYFDYNLGNKFSTYCTWVIKKNFFRAVKNHQRIMETQRSGDQSSLELGFYEENNADLEEQETKTILKKLIQKTSKNCNVRDARRQIYILEHYFGLNGKEKHTLEQISEQLGITKERVRQLKEKFLKSMRESALDLGLDLS